MTVLLLLIWVNSATGEPVKFEPVREYDTATDCEDARTEIGPQSASDGLAKVYVCALPPKQT